MGCLVGCWFGVLIIASGFIVLTVFVIGCLCGYAFRLLFVGLVIGCSVGFSGCLWVFCCFDLLSIVGDLLGCVMVAFSCYYVLTLVFAGF